MASYIVKQDGTRSVSPLDCDLQQPWIFPHNGKDGVADNGYGGDGYLTYIEGFPCSTQIPPLRMRQRDDFYNTPRIPTANNQPSSFQASIRKTWNGTYLMDDEPCLC